MKQILQAQEISYGRNSSSSRFCFGVSALKLFTVRSEGLSHNSYLIVEGKEAFVIDPRRDCQIYVRIADRHCAKIRYILETHRNEDYVVGSLDL